MKTQSKKVIIICIIVFLLLVILIGCYILLNKRTDTNPVNTLDVEQIKYNYIPKEKLGFNIVDKITIMYNYDNSSKYEESTKKLELAITGEQASSLIGLFNNYEYPDKNNVYYAVYGNYQIILSNGVEFLFDSTSIGSDEIICECIIDGESTLTLMPKELQNIVVSMVNSVLENNSKIYSTDKVTIKQDNKNIVVNDKISVDYILEQCKFIYDVPETISQEAIYEIIFNENTSLHVYENTSTAKLRNNGTEIYVKIPAELTIHIEIILNNYNHNLNEILQTDIITIQQNGKIIEITDANAINDIITFLNYSDINYESSVDYNKLIANLQEYDIALDFGKVKLIILADSQGILDGTTGNLIHEDKTTNRMLMRKDFASYIENLLK